MRGLDMLCVPTIPAFCTLDDVAADPVGPNSRLGTYTNFVNLMDLCGLAVPTAPRSDGRPGSVTLLAASGRDGRLAAMAARIEADAAAAPGTGLALPPPLPAATLGPDEMPVVAVGAHMSGLPLNHELTRLDARCLGPARTAATYRLYALEGAIRKPGLLKVAEGGSAIEVELWALPAANMGAFMQGIPAPLSIGTLTMEDGSACKGFLVEVSATAGATEITGFGGWRAYLDSPA
jgi:allophanate hydrolase